jgi:hypothetical protein
MNKSRERCRPGRTTRIRLLRPSGCSARSSECARCISTSTCVATSPTGCLVRSANARHSGSWCN